MRLIQPGDPDYPPDEILVAACKVRDWMSRHDCQQLNGLASPEYVSKVQKHLFNLVDDVWPYLHQRCTIKSIMTHYREARDFVGRGFM